jgi:hypothetical protein
MRYMLTLRALIGVFLFVSVSAYGQSIYIYCDASYDEGANIVNAFGYLAVDYNVLYYYDNSYVIVSLWSNGQSLGDSGYSSGNTAYYSVQAEPNASYYAEADGFAHTYYFYDICNVVRDYCFYYGWQPVEYYDAFDDDYWGAQYNFYGSGTGYGFGPPTWQPSYSTYFSGFAWDTVQVPCIKPTDEVSIITMHVGFAYYANGQYIGHYNGGQFDGQLKENNQNPPNNKYANRYVSESFANRFDSCYETYHGSYMFGYPAPGDPWPVNGDNKYIGDVIAAPRAWIDYYINQHVSCSGGVTQIMSISGCGSNPVEYERHGCEHVLEGIPPGASYNPKRENVGIPESWPWNY